VELPDPPKDTKHYEVQITRVAVASMSAIQHFFKGVLRDAPLVPIQALDIVLRDLPSRVCTPVSRSFFTSKHAASLGGGADVWLGHFQSVRPTQSGLMLNLDTAATAFHAAGPVIQYIADKCGLRDMRMLQRGPIRGPLWARIKKAVRGLKVEVTHMSGSYRRKYKVNGITRDGAGVQTFPGRDGGPPTRVADYFRSEYNVRLRYPHVPCLHVGNPKRTMYVPLAPPHQLLWAIHCPSLGLLRVSVSSPS
jgi:eukaryotic translation initiation factor 2C